MGVRGKSSEALKLTGMLNDKDHRKCFITRDIQYMLEWNVMKDKYGVYITTDVLTDDL